MEHKNPKLEEHCEQIAELVNAGDFGEVDEEAFDDLLDKTPYKNRQWAGDAILDTLFESAKGKMGDDGDKEVLDQLKKLVLRYEHEAKDPASIYQDTLFFPNEDNVDKLCDYIRMAKRNLRICVFTLTNNKIRNAVLDKHDEGVKVQMITDDECSKAKGSDIEYLASKGIDIRTDCSERNHMHNKFAIIDNEFLLTGSFNWTVQAGKANQENI